MSSFCYAKINIVINILMGIKAYKGEYVNIPVITNFCKNQNWI